MVLKFRARLTHPDGTSWLFYQEDQYLISFLKRVTTHIKYPSDHHAHIYKLDEGVHESYLEKPLENYLDQWTGLKDWNDKEIYNQDFLKLKQGDDDPEKGLAPFDIGVITWMDGRYVFITDDACLEMTECLITGIFDGEVIGSVHTTPELIP